MRFTSSSALFWGDTNVYEGRTGSDRYWVTGGSERMRIDSSGNLLVGTTDSNVYNDASGTGTVVQSNGIMQLAANNGTPLYANRQGTDGDIIDFRKSGTAVGSIGSFASGNYLYIGSGDTGLVFAPNIDAIIPYSTTASNYNGNVDLGYGGGTRFKDLYLSGGVYLGGTGAANKLDDYEEGTWTPTLYGTTTAGTATYAQRVGTYTKVGNLVYLQAYVVFSSFTGTSEMRISGLPFTPESGGYENHMGSIQLHQIALPSGTVQVNPRAVDGQTYLSFRVTKDNADSTYVTCDAAGELIISITYRTN
jgi:hypothetical protein